MAYLCRVCSELTLCVIDPDNPDNRQCPYGHGSWPKDDPGWP